MKVFLAIATAAGLCAPGCHTEYDAAHFDPPERQVPDTSAEVPVAPTPATKAGQEMPVPLSSAKAPDAKVSSTDREFVEEAIRVGLFEIESSRIATSKAISEIIRDYASLVIEDHVKLNRELEAIATAHAMAVPVSTNSQQNSILDQLRSLSGPPFDASYHESQVAAHEEAIELFSRAALQCRDQDLRTFARDALPLLNEHRAELDAIRAVVETARPQVE